MILSLQIYPLGDNFIKIYWFSGARTKLQRLDKLMNSIKWNYEPYCTKVQSMLRTMISEQIGRYWNTHT